MECICDNDLYWEKTKQETLNILAYSDIFDYPLTLNELYERGKIDLKELKVCLDELIQEGKVFLIKNFYSLHNERKIAEKRERRNVLAKKFMPKAKLMAKIISHFPFIRAICLSGSISKNCMDKDSDIDFFIITEPKRVWLVHLFCSLFKRVILLNRTKYFCFNFLIDSDHLAISDKSIYTAMEIKTLIPLFGYSYYKKMLEKNDWTRVFFPRFPILPGNDIIKNQSSVQKFLEFIFNNSLGDWIDNWFLAKSIERRKKRIESKFFQNPNFYTDLQKHIAKAHYKDHYPNILKEYSKKIANMSIEKVE